MNVPKGIKLTARSFDDQHAGVAGKQGDAELLIIGSNAAASTPAKMKAFTVGLTGIPATTWNAIGTETETHGTNPFFFSLRRRSPALLAC